MRIGLVCPYSLTLPGGVQGQVIGLAHAMRNLGVDARVLGPCDGPPPNASVTPLGDSVPMAANGSVAPIAPDFPCALRTVRALRDEDFDVVHLHEPLVPGPTLTALMFTESPLIGTFHRSGDSGVYPFMRPVARRVLGRLAVRCAVSADALATASNDLGGEYELVWNGIEIEQYAKAVPWPTESPTILFVGRHEPRKGLAVLLAAMAKLPTEVRLWVASDGPQTAQLRAATSDPRIEWLGRISEEEKARRLRGADVFCAPSLEGESFGVVLLEAMAASTPIVASDLPGYRNVVRAGTDALLIPPGDVFALAAGLSRALTDSQLRGRLIDSAECRAAGFSMEHLAERYVEIYRQVVSQPGRPERGHRNHRSKQPHQSARAH